MLTIAAACSIISPAFTKNRPMLTPEHCWLCTQNASRQLWAVLSRLAGAVEFPLLAPTGLL